MADAAKGLIEQGKPWRSDVKWQVVAVEAVLLVVIGLFMLFNTERAGDWILQIVGLVLLVASAQVAMLAFRHSERSLGAFDAFRAGIGVTAGVIAMSIWWSDSIGNNAVRLILAWGLIAFPLLQLVGIFTTQGRANLRPATLILSTLTLVLGILLLTSGSGNASGRISFLGTVLLVFGLLLGALAYFLMSRDNATENQPA